MSKCKEARYNEPPRIGGVCFECIIFSPQHASTSWIYKIGGVKGCGDTT